MKKPVTLIFTNSFDQTVDRLVRHIGADRIFRFNLDLWRDYRISIVRGDFSIVNPLGHEVRQADVAKFFWRKPLSKFRLKLDATGASEQDFYLEEEVYYAVREIRSMMARLGKIVLIEPESTERSGKLTQMEAAHRYFDVPPYEFSYDPLRRRASRQRIVKSLTSGRLDDRNFFLWTTQIDEAELDPATPWFIQDLVDAKLDITVVFVRNAMWTSSLDRSLFIDRTVDWREEGTPMVSQWQPHALPKEFEVAITAYMSDISLHYGRLDFLYDGRRYWFLEVNSNGEWGWLDRDGTKGLLNKIAEEIHPDTALYSIPIIDPLRLSTSRVNAKSA